MTRVKCVSIKWSFMNDKSNHSQSSHLWRNYNKIPPYQVQTTLRKFTQTEGQILIKLIHRQTGTTAYKLIKELRNGWSAFWYNNTARVFNMSLKREFDPYLVEEDYLIEDIIQRSLRDKKLEYQNSHIKYDLFELEKQWR